MRKRKPVLSIYFAVFSIGYVGFFTLLDFCGVPQGKLISANILTACFLVGLLGVLLRSVREGYFK